MLLCRYPNIKAIELFVVSKASLDTGFACICYCITLEGLVVFQEVLTGLLLAMDIYYLYPCLEAESNNCLIPDYSAVKFSSFCLQLCCLRRFISNLSSSLIFKTRALLIAW
jgi:hypothetical protein